MSTPLLILAPMYDVTDVVFRQVIATCGAPDLFMTEFVNVDGLQSPGRSKLLPYLYQEESSIPLYAQIWGQKPENFYKTASELAARGFAGIDLNMGCPEKNILKNPVCAALIAPDLRSKAADIIAATKDGAGNLPVSVKTRLGLREIDLSWPEFLLHQDITMLTIHGRTVAEKSKVPAHWEIIGQIKQLAKKISPATKIIGNGDIQSRKEALELCQTYAWDGAMIGRAIFNDPFIFAPQSPWKHWSIQDKIGLYQRHLKLHQQIYPDGERKFEPLKKFMKVYLTGFDDAQQLRLKLATTKNTRDALDLLESFKSNYF